MSGPARGQIRGFIIATEIGTRPTIAKPGVSKSIAAGDSIVPTICLPKSTAVSSSEEPQKKPPIREEDENMAWGGGGGGKVFFFVLFRMIPISPCE